MSDWEYSDSACPKCSQDLATQDCNECGGEGTWEDEDCNGLEYVPCDGCNGTGYHEWCRECGWDAVFKRFLQPKYEQEYLEKLKGNKW